MTLIFRSPFTYFGEKAEMKAMWTIRKNQQGGKRVINSWYKSYILFSKGTAQRNTSYLYERQFQPLSSRWFWSTQNAPVEHSTAYTLFKGANVQPEEFSNKVSGCQGTSYMSTQNKNTCKVCFQKQISFWNVLRCKNYFDNSSSPGQSVGSIRWVKRSDFRIIALSIINT